MSSTPTVLPPDQALPQTHPQGRLSLQGAMQTHPGPTGALNEDTAAYFLPRPDAPFARHGALALVADGMGGHAAGEIASRLAADIISAHFYDQSGPVPGILAACFEAANTAIHQRSKTDPKCAGMGATCTAIAVRDDHLYLGHVGDSRAYLLRQATLRQISQDHSVVADLVRKGTITPSEAMRSPIRNLVIRALGIGPTVEPQLWAEGLPLQSGDVIFLCSDGLSDSLDDDAIARILQSAPPLVACSTLIAEALRKGGKDNISLGVFTVNENSLTLPDSEQPTRTIPIDITPGISP